MAGMEINLEKGGRGEVLKKEFTLQRKLFIPRISDEQSLCVQPDLDNETSCEFPFEDKGEEGREIVLSWPHRFLLSGDYWCPAEAEEPSVCCSGAL